MCRSELYALVKTQLLENECEYKVEPKEWTYGSNLKIKKTIKITQQFNVDCLWKVMVGGGRGVYMMFAVSSNSTS